MNLEQVVNEFRTSCKCSCCNGGDCKKFIKIKNPKPYKDNFVLVHGLLKCQSCNTMWNRDVNGASNIYKIAYTPIIILKMALFYKNIL